MIRAAQYLRMSTEHQQYSIANQIAAISEYASAHGFEIIRSYSDEARSGIDLKRRPGLRQLLQDVITRAADFEAVLVYDVSRWGRFQDTDESAHYEFLCKQAGVQVSYCAEQFVNDGTMLASLIKAVKRSMAGEYLRELSVKVYAGQRKLTTLGYRMGARPRYGLRRMLLSPDGTPVRQLGPGEWASKTQRIVLAPGPQTETAVIRKVFSMYLDHDMPVKTITNWLNSRKIAKGNGYPWTVNYVRRVLGDPQYAGCAVYGRVSRKLGAKQTQLAREKWVIQPNSFAPIVPLEAVLRAQAKLSSFFYTDERLRELLRTQAEKKGSIEGDDITRRNGLPHLRTVERRFGSLLKAYEAAGIHPIHWKMWQREHLKCHYLRERLSDELKRALATAACQFTVRDGFYEVEACDKFGFEIGRCMRIKCGLRWRVWSRNFQAHPCVVARLNPGNTRVQDWCLIECCPTNSWQFRIKEDEVAKNDSVRLSAEDIVALIMRRLGIAIRNS